MSYPLGERLKELRETKRLSQKQMGGAIGIDQSEVCRVEKGKRRLTAEELGLACDVLDLSPHERLEVLRLASEGGAPAQAAG